MSKVKGTAPKQQSSVKRLFPLALALLVSACSLMAPKFQRPTLSVVGVELVSGNLLQQNFRVKFNIQNPNDRALPVSGLRVTLNVGGEVIAQGQNDRAFVVPANGNSDFDMSITANVAVAMIKLANSVNQHADAIDYDVSGSASIDLPFLRDLPFHQTGSFALR